MVQAAISLSAFRGGRAASDRRKERHLQSRLAVGESAIDSSQGRCVSLVGDWQARATIEPALSSALVSRVGWRPVIVTSDPPQGWAPAQPSMPRRGRVPTWSWQDGAAQTSRKVRGAAPLFCASSNPKLKFHGGCLILPYLYGPPPSSSGLGHRLFMSATGVRISLGVILRAAWGL